MECIFCKIVAKEIQAEIVSEDAAALAVMDIHPRSPGHIFIIPKRHAMHIGEVKAEDIGPLFAAVRNAAELVKNALSPDGLTIGINEGRAGGQEIDHLHIHIMPRWQGDGGGSVQSVVANAPKESIKAIAERIRAARK
jgi:histidine triad (HIT) family protein